MNNTVLMIAKLIAEAAIAFQKECTGHAPKMVSLVLSESTLVVTLHDALSPADRVHAKSSKEVSEVHRQLFAACFESLFKEVNRVSGGQVREAAADVESTSGSIVHAFTTGTMVQVFSLNGSTDTEAWSGHDLEVRDLF